MCRQACAGNKPMRRRTLIRPAIIPISSFHSANSSGRPTTMDAMRARALQPHYASVPTATLRTLGSPQLQDRSHVLYNIAPAFWASWHPEETHQQDDQMSQRRPTDRHVPAHAVASVKRLTASTHSMHQHGQPWQLPGLLRRAGAMGPKARGRIMDGRVAVQRARDALVLAQHALGGARVRQHIVDGAHALRVQACRARPAE